MIYRIATLCDLNQILSMKNRVKERIVKENLPIWLNGYPLDEMISEDIDLQYGRVVEIDGKIVSYAVFLPSNIEYEDHIPNVENKYSFGRVMVDDNYTGLGIGRFLVSNMINEAKQNGSEGMIITADNCNKKATNLYESFGFIKIGEKQFPYAYLTIYELIF